MKKHDNSRIEFEDDCRQRIKAFLDTPPKSITDLSLAIEKLRESTGVELTAAQMNRFLSGESLRKAREEVQKSNTPLKEESALLESLKDISGHGWALISVFALFFIFIVIGILNGPLFNPEPAAKRPKSRYYENFNHTSEEVDRAKQVIRDAGGYEASDRNARALLDAQGKADMMEDVRRRAAESP